MWLKPVVFTPTSLSDHDWSYLAQFTDLCDSGFKIVYFKN